MKQDFIRFQSNLLSIKNHYRLNERKTTLPFIFSIRIFYEDTFNDCQFYLAGAHGAKCGINIEPRHDKTNKLSVRPAKTQISLGIRQVWSVFAICMKKAWVLSYQLGAQRRLWSDWGDAKADQSLRRAHSHIVGFVMSRLIFSFIFSSM